MELLLEIRTLLMDITILVISAERNILIISIEI